MSIDQYSELLQRYVTGSLDTEELARLFNEAFRNEPASMPRDLFLIIEDAFEAIEACYPGTLPEEETRVQISEQTLKLELKEILARLQAYVERDL